MAFDAFIKIDDIEGESTDDKYPGWIEVLDCGVGIKQKISRTASSAGGASAERADFHDFNVTKQIDIAGVGVGVVAAGASIKMNEIVKDNSGNLYDRIMDWLGALWD